MIYETRHLRRRGAALLVVSSILLAGRLSAGTVAKDNDMGFSQRTVVYKTVGDVQLKMYFYVPAASATSKTPRPAIVFFFGGGWVGGSPSQFFPHCERLAAAGMVCASAEYRVKKQHGTTPRECVQDGKSAIRWLRAHAAELGIDPGRIAAGGGSAGGHVAAATATVTGFEEAGEDLTISARPNALVLFNPVFNNGPDHGWGHAAVKDYWQAISPYHNIHPGTPPTIVFLGTNDKLVPVSVAEGFKKQMEACGNRCEVHLYQGAGHGFFNHNRDGGKYFRLTMTEAERFLVSLGYLSADAVAGAGSDAP